MKNDTERDARKPPVAPRSCNVSQKFNWTIGAAALAIAALIIYLLRHFLFG